MNLSFKFGRSKAASAPATSSAPTSRPSSPTGAATGRFVLNNTAGGSSRNWQSEAGRLQDNSAVSILLGIVCNNFADAPLTIRRHDGNGGYDIVPDHPLALLMKRPNEYWTRTQLFRALLTSLYLDGNGYLFKARNQFGVVVELWWLPHNAITVLTDESGFVTGYKYKVKSSETIYSPADVIHLKIGVNTERPELGESPLRAILREVCTDNEVLNYTYAILKNVGVPGVILSPKILKGEDGDTVPTVTETIANKVKAVWRRLTTGDNRGEPLVMTIPWDVTIPGFKPQEMLLDKVGQLAEVRIAGAFGVPVIVAQFLSGLENTNAKASYEEAIQQLYGCCLIPLQRLVCEWLDLQLLAELGDPKTEHFWFDRSEISALQEKVSEVWQRAKDAFTSGFIKLSEARKMIGLATGDGDVDGYYWELNMGLGGFGSLVAGAGTDATSGDEGAKRLSTRVDKHDPTDPEKVKAASLALAERWRRAGLEAPEVEVLA